MTFVLDSSMALTFVLADEATAETDKILDRFGQGDSAAVPALWRWEVGNALLIAERRKRLTKAEGTQHLNRLRLLPVAVDESAWHEAWSATRLLAEKHSLTLYDSAYLELALRRGAPLASLDAALRQAAKSESIDLLPEKV